MLKICGESHFKTIRDFTSKKISFLMNGKKQMWFQSIKKVISKCQETSELLNYFRYVEKYLNVNLFEFFINSSSIRF